MRDGARVGHKAPGRDQWGGHAVFPCDSLIRQLQPFFRRKKDNIRKKITEKVSGQSELRICIYSRNGETEPGGNAETER